MVTNNYDTVLHAINSFKSGNPVIVMDHKSRENEGDLVINASLATPSQLAFMIRYTSGYICAPMDLANFNRLNLKLMVLPSNSTDKFNTQYAIPLDYSKCGTGISAHDRCLTINKLADQSSTSNMFNMPGHVVPLLAKPSLILERMGHTEASITLCVLAETPKVAAISELINDNGTMKNAIECQQFAKKFDIKIVSTEMIKEYVQLNNILLN